MEVKGRKVLVFGAGISGIGAAGLLEANGADVILYDGNEKLDPASLKEQLGEKSGAAVLTGKLPQETITSLDMAVLSPGVPTDLPVVLAMKEAGVQVIGEIELAYQFGKGDVLAITGTNGKTTTTSLLGQIMKQAREEVYVVGNIGNPYTAVAGQMTEQAVTVAEISSFQLETIREFRPKVSAILNITPDHLNRHHTMEAYIEAKENIAVNQTEDDFCILNYEDRLLREFGENLRAKVRKARERHNWQIQQISSENLELAKKVVHDWAKLREKTGDGDAALIGLENFEELGLQGIMMGTEAGPQAIAYGAVIAPDVFDFHVEKTLMPSIINYAKWELYQRLPDRIRWINLEEDLNLPGLKNNKLQAVPAKIVPLWKGVPV